MAKRQRSQIQDGHQNGGKIHWGKKNPWGGRFFPQDLGRKNTTFPVRISERRGREYRTKAEQDF